MLEHCAYRMMPRRSWTWSWRLCHRWDWCRPQCSSHYHSSPTGFPETQSQHWLLPESWPNMHSVFSIFNDHFTLTKKIAIKTTQGSGARGKKYVSNASMFIPWKWRQWKQIGNTWHERWWRCSKRRWASSLTPWRNPDLQNTDKQVSEKKEKSNGEMRTGALHATCWRKRPCSQPSYAGHCQGCDWSVIDTKQRASLVWKFCACGSLSICRGCDWCCLFHSVENIMVGLSGNRVKEFFCKKWFTSISFQRGCCNSDWNNSLLHVFHRHPVNKMEQVWQISFCSFVCSLEWCGWKTSRLNMCTSFFGMQVQALAQSKIAQRKGGYLNLWPSQSLQICVKTFFSYCCG